MKTDGAEMKKGVKKVTAALVAFVMSFMCLPHIAEADGGAAIFKAGGEKTVFEAESIDYDSKIFTRISEGGMSGGAGLYTSSGRTDMPEQTEDGAAEFYLAASEDGIYKIWLRVNPTTLGKSMYISINDGEYSKWTMGGTANEWNWVCMTSVCIKKDSSVKFKMIPSNGYFRIDKFLVTNSRAACPSGIEGDLVYADTTITNTRYNPPKITPAPEHPRLYFRKKDIAQIMNNANKTENYQAYSMHKLNLEQNTNGKLALPEEGKSNANNTWLGWFESWAFEYAVNGNEELGRRAIDSLKNFMSTVVYIDKNNDGYTRNAGQLVFTAAEVYDWCYPLLTEEDKAFIIETAISIIGDGIEVGWPPVKQGGVTGHGSEAQILRDLLGFAIAVADERPDIYNMVAGRFFDVFVPARKYHYDGHMFHQGSGYGNYRGQWDYISTWIYDRMGNERIYGDEQQWTAYWFIYLLRPDGIPFTDGDASYNGIIPGNPYTGYKRIFYLAANYYKDPYLKYMAQKMSINSSLSYGHGNTTPVEFLLFNDPDFAAEPIDKLPLTKYFGSPMGNMIARTGWNEGLDSNDAAVYMKIGEQWFANHHHLDFGHFQIYYKGLLASDSGRYESYGTAHDGAYNKRTIAHNTMLVYDPSENMTYMKQNVNDGGQRIAGGEKATLDDLLAGDYKYGTVLGAEYGPDLSEPDYSYLKGDLTNAYSSSKMRSFDRSFMFYNLKNEEHPAVLITFDRVVSTNKNYKKTWLLHGVAEPEVSGNRTVFRNDENGYNGKLTVDTLLPKSTNTQINVVGGLNNEFYVNGVNYPSTGKDGQVTSALRTDRIHDSDGYRIEVSPKTASETDYFLNVMQVGESNPDTAAMTPELIETNLLAGVKIADRVCVFSKGKGRTSDNISFNFSGNGSYKINVADVAAGSWTIKYNGQIIGNAVSNESGGVLNFEGSAGKYELVYNMGAQNQNLPVTIGSTYALSYKNDIKVNADIEGTAKDGAKVIFAVYDGEKNMIHIEQVPYTGSKAYEFIIPESLGDVSKCEARVMVWSGEYDAVPIAASSSCGLF